MKKILIFIIFYFNLIQHTLSNDYEIRILYKVNENIITNIDVINEIKYLKLIDENYQNINSGKIKEIALKSLVKEFIKKDEIQKFYNIDYNSPEVDKYLMQLAAKLGLTNISDFDNYLSQNNIKLKDIREKLVIEKTWNSLIYEIYYKKIVINEKQISDKLENIINKNTYQKSFRLSEIVFSASNKSNFEKKYDKILKDIKETNFNQAAIIHSISDTANAGGEIGWVKSSQLSKKIYDELKNLKVEQLTKPITTPGGIMILKINEIKNVPSEEIDKDLELSNMIKNEKNRQLNEYSIIHFKKVEQKSYVKKI